MIKWSIYLWFPFAVHKHQASRTLRSGFRGATRARLQSASPAECCAATLQACPKTAWKRDWTAKVQRQVVMWRWLCRKMTNRPACLSVSCRLWGSTLKVRFTHTRTHTRIEARSVDIKKFQKHNLHVFTAKNYFPASINRQDNYVTVSTKGEESYFTGI